MSYTHIRTYVLTEYDGIRSKRVSCEMGLEMRRPGCGAEPLRRDEIREKGSLFCLSLTKKRPLGTSKRSQEDLGSVRYQTIHLDSDQMPSRGKGVLCLVVIDDSSKSDRTQSASQYQSMLQERSSSSSATINQLCVHVYGTPYIRSSDQIARLAPSLVIPDRAALSVYLHVM